eukprot:3454187-Pleurochrysis_carterae.AAC.5
MRDTCPQNNGACSGQTRSEGNLVGSTGRGCGNGAVIPAPSESVNGNRAAAFVASADRRAALCTSSALGVTTGAPSPKTSSQTLAGDAMSDVQKCRRASRIGTSCSAL